MGCGNSHVKERIQEPDVSQQQENKENSKIIISNQDKKQENYNEQNYKENNLSQSQQVTKDNLKPYSELKKQEKEDKIIQLEPEFTLTNNSQKENLKQNDIKNQQQQNQINQNSIKSQSMILTVQNQQQVSSSQQSQQFSLNQNIKNVDEWPVEITQIPLVKQSELQLRQNQNPSKIIETEHPQQDIKQIQDQSIIPLQQNSENQQSASLSINQYSKIQRNNNLNNQKEDSQQSQKILDQKNNSQDQIIPQFQEQNQLQTKQSPSNIQTKDSQPHQDYQDQNQQNLNQMHEQIKQEDKQTKNKEELLIQHQTKELSTQLSQDDYASLGMTKEDYEWSVKFLVRLIYLGLQEMEKLQQQNNNNNQNQHQISQVKQIQQQKKQNLDEFKNQEEFKDFEEQKEQKISLQNQKQNNLSLQNDKEEEKSKENLQKQSKFNKAIICTQEDFFEEFDQDQLLKVPLGKGGSGDVCKMKSKLDQKEYAMKVMSFPDRDKFIDAQKETEVYTTIKHSPYIIETYKIYFYQKKMKEIYEKENKLRENDQDATKIDQNYYKFQQSLENNALRYIVLQMELAQSSLEQIIKQKRIQQQPFSKEEIDTLIENLLSAFTYLLDQKFHHQDVKPANILYTFDKRWVLTDFNLAVQVKQVTENQQTTHRVGGGTLFYVSPQYKLKQAIKKTHLDLEKHDVFACGLTILRVILLLEEKKIEDMNDWETGKQKIEDFLKQVQNPFYKHLLENMLEHDQAQRWAFSEAFASYQANKLLGPGIMSGMQYLNKNFKEEYKDFGSVTEKLDKFQNLKEQRKDEILGRIVEKEWKPKFEEMMGDIDENGFDGDVMLDKLQGFLQDLGGWAKQAEKAQKSRNPLKK